MKILNSILNLIKKDTGTGTGTGTGTATAGTGDTNVSNVNNVSNINTSQEVQQLDTQKIKLMISTLFPLTQVKQVEELINYFVEYQKLGMDSTLRVAHFLAQVREEIGPEFKPLFENLNYTPASLLKTFKNFTPELAEKYGRTKGHSANQEMIANIAYSNKLGNGSVESGDGYRYRGTGSLQITGKYNFSEVQKRIDAKAPNSEINIDSGKGVNTLKGTLLIGLGYWFWKDLHRIADMGATLETVDDITAVINKYTSSYKSRQEHFKKIKEFI